MDDPRVMEARKALGAIDVYCSGPEPKPDIIQSACKRALKVMELAQLDDVLSKLKVRPTEASSSPELPENFEGHKPPARVVTTRDLPPGRDTYSEEQPDHVQANSIKLYCELAHPYLQPHQKCPSCMVKGGDLASA